MDELDFLDDVESFHSTSKRRQTMVNSDCHLLQKVKQPTRTRKKRRMNFKSIMKGSTNAKIGCPLNAPNNENSDEMSSVVEDGESKTPSCCTSSTTTTTSKSVRFSQNLQITAAPQPISSPVKESLSSISSVESSHNIPNHSIAVNRRRHRTRSKRAKINGNSNPSSLHFKSSFVSSSSSQPRPGSGSGPGPEHRKALMDIKIGTKLDNGRSTLETEIRKGPKLEKVESILEKLPLKPEASTSLSETKLKRLRNCSDSSTISTDVRTNDAHNSSDSINKDDNATVFLRRSNSLPVGVGLSSESNKFTQMRSKGNGKNHGLKNDIRKQISSVPVDKDENGHNLHRSNSLSHDGSSESLTSTRDWKQSARMKRAKKKTKNCSAGISIHDNDVPTVSTHIFSVPDGKYENKRGLSLNRSNSLPASNASSLLSPQSFASSTDKETFTYMKRPRDKGKTYGLGSLPVDNKDTPINSAHNASQAHSKYGKKYFSNSVPVGKYDNRNGLLHRSYSLSTLGDGSSTLSYETENVVTGAGADALAIQDAGSHRFILDDCSYLCSSLLACKEENSINSIEGSGKPMSDMRHNFITADASCKLAVMLSSKKTRGLLLSLGESHDKKESKHEEKDKVDSSGFLQSLFNVFGCAPIRLIDSPLPPSVLVVESSDWDKITKKETKELCSSNHDLSTNIAEKLSRTKNARTKAVVDKDKNVDIPISRKKERGPLFNELKFDSPLLDQYDSAVTMALAIIAHYLSFDCTESYKHSAANSLVAGRRIRRNILKHQEAMCGISRLLLVDPVVSSILRMMHYSPTKISLQNSIEVQPVASEVNDSTADIQLLQKNNGCIEMRDPTKIGRKRMHRRKFFMTEKCGEGATKPPAQLDTLHEEISSCNNENEQNDNIIIFSRKADDGSKNTCTSNGLEFSNSEESGSCGNDLLNTPYLNELPRKLRRHFDKLLCRIAKSSGFEIESVVADGNQSRSKSSDCSNCQRVTISVDSSPDLSKMPFMANPGLLALDALNRILTGNAGDKTEEDLNLQDEIDDNDCYHDEQNGSMKENESAKEDLNNPLIYKNVMLRRSGSIYFLARSIVEAFEAVSCIIIGKRNDEAAVEKTVKDSQHPHTNCCLACLSYLRHKTNCLSSIIDGACCLSDTNRIYFCGVGRTSNQSYNMEEVILVPSLINCICQVAYKTSDDRTQFDELFSDIGLAAFRTLTSLTHDNEKAALQLMAMYEIKGNFPENDKRQSGVAIIFRVLCHLVMMNQSRRSESLGDQSSIKKSKKSSLTNYDATIFCFNILTNILETPAFHDARKVISMLRINTVDGEVLGLRWLTCWVVDLTITYREALMMGSFGDKNTDGTKRVCDLKHNDDEYLVMAGNGFIFLASLMRQGNVNDNIDSGIKVELSSQEEERTLYLRNLILSEMPKDHKRNWNSTTLMIKSLKAFCNFYRYTIGELSVAIVPSVQLLIAELETIKS